MDNIGMVSGVDKLRAGPYSWVSFGLCKRNGSSPDPMRIGDENTVVDSDLQARQAWDFISWAFWLALDRSTNEISCLQFTPYDGMTKVPGYLGTFFVWCL